LTSARLGRPSWWLRVVAAARGVALAADHGLAAPAGCAGDQLQRDLGAGADDFIAHPARYLELHARLCALPRRSDSPLPAESFQVGPLRIETATYAATLHDEHLQLSRLEYELLLHLARNPRRVFRKLELLGPTAIARGHGRSTGAVGSCLKRLAANGQASQTGEHPRRYTTVKVRAIDNTADDATRPRAGMSLVVVVTVAYLRFWHGRVVRGVREVVVLLVGRASPVRGFSRRWCLSGGLERRVFRFLKPNKRAVGLFLVPFGVHS
jgi:hypothetical protein